MDDYRIERTESAWRVVHPDRGAVGGVVPEGGRFVAMVNEGETPIVIGSGHGVRDAVAQVIWYDRAMNLEAA